ncbi:MAG: glycoside hydrolase family 3 N-terminal domain-containing protein [candidate division Zixibacteria bacterium]|nr:glycoside hydrolase family 3 N-terminal domain-containing protein [candidate division Zixibacteria bacterium]
MQNIIDQIGQLFLVGFTGSEPSRSFLDFLARNQIGGVILFEEGCTTPSAVRSNVEKIRDQYRGGISPFIAIDQEGGRICRLRGAPAEYRSAAHYGENSDVEHFAEDYLRAAVYMESIGINLNLAPVADIFLEPRNNCLKDRCFGTTVEVVKPFVEKAVKVSGKSGLLSCLKHFPGLGASEKDPHEQTPIVAYDEIIWQQREMVPFVAGVEAGADMIMTTHLRLKGFGGEIVTASGRIISTLLRGLLAFDGPVVTDDLTMEGATPLGGIGERTVAAFNAGHDILLFGQDFRAAMRAYDYFCAAVKRGEIAENQLRSAISRVSGIKFKLDSSVLR